MIALIVKYEVAPADVDNMAAGLREVAPLVHQHEPGCLTWQASRSNENPNAFWIYEVYRDQAALDEHRQTTHFQDIVVNKIRPLAVAREASQCEVITD